MSRSTNGKGPAAGPVGQPGACHAANRSKLSSAGPDELLRTASTTRVRTLDDVSGAGAMVLELIDLSPTVTMTASNQSQCWSSDVPARFGQSFSELTVAIRPGPGGALVVTEGGDGPNSLDDLDAAGPLSSSVTLEVHPGFFSSIPFKLLAGRVYPPSTSCGNGGGIRL